MKLVSVSRSVRGHTGQRNDRKRDSEYGDIPGPPSHLGIHQAQIEPTASIRHFGVAKPERGICVEAFRGLKAIVAAAWI